MEDFQVLASGVENLDLTRLGHQLPQRFQVKVAGKRINGCGSIRAGNLDQAEFWVIGLLTHKLGVHRDEIGG